MSDEFIDRLVNHSDFIEEERFAEPWSPLPPIPQVDAFEFEADDPALALHLELEALESKWSPIPPPPQVDPFELEDLADDPAPASHLDLEVGAIDTSPNRSHRTSAVDYSDSVNLDSSMDIPEYDFDFSDGADSDHASAAHSDESDDTDGSIIGDW